MAMTRQQIEDLIEEKFDSGFARIEKKIVKLFDRPAPAAPSEPAATTVTSGGPAPAAGDIKEQVRSALVELAKETQEKAPVSGGGGFLSNLLKF